jgi:hypothetical protein
MRQLAVLLLLLVGTPVFSAPAPVFKPRPKPPRPFWEIDFSPLAKAGTVNLSLFLSIRTVDGQTRQASVGQSGRALVAPIIDAFAGSFQKGDLVIDPGKTRMTIKAMQGQPIASVELVLKNLDQKFSPLVLPPGKK